MTQRKRFYKINMLYAVFDVYEPFGTAMNIRSNSLP